jgi:hypothetical protein
MKWRVLLSACLLFCATLINGGCTQLRQASSAKTMTSRTLVGKPIDPEQVERVTMNFAVRYMTATADVYDQVRTRSTTPEARTLAQQSKLNANVGALSKCE